MEKNKKNNYIDAIQAIYPQVDMSVGGVANCTNKDLNFYLSDPYNYETLEWNSTELTKPTKEELDNKIIQLQADYESKFYQIDRKENYPDITDQLDMIYHAIAADPDMQTIFNNFYTNIKSIKDKYPKE